MFGSDSKVKILHGRLYVFNIIGSRQDKDYQEGRQGHYWEVLHPSQYGFPYKQEDLWGGGHHSHKVAKEQDCGVSTVRSGCETIDLFYSPVEIDKLLTVT